MRIIIHDLGNTDFQKLFPQPLDDTMVIASDAKIHHCLGCFGCWTKTPGACVIRDKYGDIGEGFSKCSEALVFSRCYYGGFSPFVKNVFDRSISYMHPDFRNRYGEMHHKRRYKNCVDLLVFFYGEDITEREQQVARDLVKANAINMCWDVAGVSFSHGIAELEGRVS
jgi:multimeric flavodoxin WrbA